MRLRKLGMFRIVRLESECGLHLVDRHCRIAQAHGGLGQAAVRAGVTDADELVKPKAFVVLRPGQQWHDGMAAELQAFIKSRLAPYKYPRQIECVPELPKTATGKIQRFRLRQREQAAREAAQ